MEPRRLRTFSLFESQRKKGGKSRFRAFLSNLGHVMRPYLNRLATVGASALTDKVTQAMGKSVGKNALELGSKIISEVAKGKTEKLLNHIKGGGGGGFTGLPDDISEKLTVENKKSLASFVGRKKKRKSSTKKIKRKTKRKVGKKKISKTKKRKTAGRKPKKAGRKPLKAGRKPKKAGRKKGGVKAGGRKIVTKTKRKTVTSIFD